MNPLKELKLKSKDAILVRANGRPVTYWNASHRWWWLAALAWLLKRGQRRR
jgi:hypothetical protein